jgi:UDP-glucose 4-epimerase
MMRRILIPGGFGYLGGRLAKFLAFYENYKILLGTRRQIPPPFWLPNASVFVTPWNSLSGLEKICSDVDIVVHLAGMNAQECASNSAMALEVNAVATARLVQAAVRHKVKRIIYISTAHVYGNPLTGVISEDTSPAPVHPYAFSHRAGEDVVMASHQSGDIEGIVVRLSNAYGVPANKNANCWMLLINDLCRQAVTSGKLVLHSSGMQRRDFISIHDVVRGIKHLMELPSDKFRSGLFNLGGEASYRVIDLAKLIAIQCEGVLGFKPEIDHPEPKPDEKSMELDFRIDRLKKTGFCLSGDITNEIDLTLKFCHKAFGKPS